MEGAVQQAPQVRIRYDLNRSGCWHRGGGGHQLVSHARQEPRRGERKPASCSLMYTLRQGQHGIFGHTIPSGHDASSEQQQRALGSIKLLLLLCRIERTRRKSEACPAGWVHESKTNVNKLHKMKAREGLSRGTHENMSERRVAE